MKLSEALEILGRTPDVLRALLGELSEVWTTHEPGPGWWSANHVLGHLIHGERTDWIPRAEIILAQGPDRHFAPYDRFAQLREDQSTPLGTLLDEFTRLRAENLSTLAGWHLTDAQLALRGEHPEFGAVTLRQLLATWVAHDLSHVAQVARVMARQYREAVGPWRAYLSIMGQ